MTIASSQTKIQYSPNGIASAFPFPYLFLDNEHLTVILTDSVGLDTVLQLASHYTVTGAGSQNGGTVTLLTVPAIGTTLTILREVPVSQETDYLANDSFPAETHERALDKLTMICQELIERVNRSITFPKSEPVVTSGELSSAALRANMILSFDTQGNVSFVNFDDVIAGIDLSAAPNVIVTDLSLSAYSHLVVATINPLPSPRLRIRGWLVDAAYTTPTLIKTLTPPNGNTANEFDAVTDALGEVTFALSHTSTPRSWRMCIEAMGTVVISNVITLGV